MRTRRARKFHKQFIPAFDMHFSGSENQTSFVPDLKPGLLRQKGTMDYANNKKGKFLFTCYGVIDIYLSHTGWILPDAGFQG